MLVRFWGTRGSIAKPGLRTTRYGGNTSCVEVRAPDGTLIVLDCGTWAHDLGQALMAEAQLRRGHSLREEIGRLNRRLHTRRDGRAGPACAADLSLTASRSKRAAERSTRHKGNRRYQSPAQSWS